MCLAPRFIVDCARRGCIAKGITQVHNALEFAQIFAGIGGEAMRALMAFLFDSCGKHRLVLRMNGSNAAALALAASLGFREEGRFVDCILGKEGWEDEVLCAMLRSEWR